MKLQQQQEEEEEEEEEEVQMVAVEEAVEYKQKDSKDDKINDEIKKDDYDKDNDNKVSKDSKDSGSFDGFSFFNKDTRSKGTCRNKDKLLPHQNSLWESGFPSLVTPRALCNGNIFILDETICVDGRVTYEQIMDKVGKPMHAPTSPTISVNGHLTSGTGNVVLGPSRKLIYDFITSYVVDGKNYASSKQMTNRLLGGSYGTIDGFCLNKTIFEAPSEYRIKQKIRMHGLADSDDVATAGYIYGTYRSLLIEQHIPIENDIFNFWSWNPFPRVGLDISNLISMFPMPQIFTFLFGGWLDIFTGIVRLNLVGGVYETDEYPQPYVDTNDDIYVENWQLDCKWETFLNAIDNGLFFKPRIPWDIKIVIKKITTSKDTYSCWGNDDDLAAIDVIAPIPQSRLLDNYIEYVLYPQLKKFGDVTVHLGKRLKTGASAYASTWEFYKNKCGIDVGLTQLTGSKCIHPACQRINEVNTFQYPSKYYEFSNETYDGESSDIFFESSNDDGSKDFWWRRE